MKKRIDNVLVLNDTSNGCHYGCDAVMDTLLEWMGQVTTYPCGFTDNISDEELQNIIREYNVVLVNGEGSIHHDNKRARGLARIGFLSKGIARSYLVNATLYKNNKETMASINNFDFVSVRDNYSKCGSDYFVTPDLTFWQHVKISRLGNGITVSDSNQKDVRGALEKLGKSRGWRYRRITHPRGKGHYRRYIKELGNHRGIVTGRFHDVCFCINHEIPFLAIESNTNKVESILYDCFGNTDRLVDKIDIGYIKEVPLFTEKESRSIDEYVKKGRGSLQHLSNILSIKDK